MSAARKFLFATVTAGFCFFAGVAQTIPDFKLGDTAAQDVSTPFKLIVPDADKTKSLRDAVKVPAVFRFDPRVSASSESNLVSALNQKRDEFQGRVESTFGRRPVKWQQVPFARFQKLAANFLRQNKGLPLTTNLLEAWALDQSDEQIRSTLVTKFHSAAGQFIRASELPPGLKVGSKAKLVTTTNLDGKLADEFIAQHNVVMLRSNVPTLIRARGDLVKSFPQGERATGKTLAAMLHENCFFDLELTRADHEKKAGAMLSAAEYEPGQLILKRGQAVDAKAVAALEQLRDKMKISQAQVATGLAPRDDRWLLAGVIGLSAVLLFAMVLLARRKNSATGLSLQLARGNPGDVMIACPACNEKIVVPLAGIAEIGPEEHWKHRALAAEASTRRGVFSQFAKVLKDKFVTKLLSERNQILDTHDKAATTVAELEARLREVNAPLQERLSAYQDRITELEKELTVRGEENRELIKAKIQLAKTKSEIAETKNRMEFN